MLAMLLFAIPDADPLPMPAPPALLWGLLLLTFFLHVVAMNFVLGGSLIALVARIRRSHDGNAAALAAWMGKLMPTMVAAAVTFGVAPLLFLQALYGRLFFTSAILMGWYWFAVVPVLILAYYGTYAVAFRGIALRTGLVAIIGAVSLLFLAIAFIYSNNMTLMLRPEQFLPMFLESGRGLHLNLGDPTLVPRYLHMLLGAVAIAGLAVSVYGMLGRGSAPEHRLWAIHHGARWFAGATILNVITGIWWLGALPGEVLLRFMGQSGVATISLAVGVLAGFVALALMFSAMQAAEPRPLVLGSVGAVLLTLVAMVISRDEVRRGMLELAGFRMTTWIEPQWDVIAIFAVLLVGALTATVWMAVMVLRPRPA